MSTDGPAVSSATETPSTTHAQRPADGDIDWDALRARSLEVGGFGADRVTIWPRLLHVDVPSSSTPPLDDDDDTSSLEPDQHRDERQIRLDTDRSFVLYPEEESRDDRTRLQSELYELIVSVFRRHPGLNYFQGYHDIVTVMFLTLPPEVQLAATEKLSLHRLRDAMGTTLEPLLGLLRILQRLLRLVDLEFANILEEQAPLPYAALSHLLTLFSHDLPTLGLVQHVFDYLLSRPPIVVVYLAAAIILSHRAEVLMLEREGEEGMIHSVLTSLPDFLDGQDEQSTSKTANAVSSASADNECPFWPLHDIAYPTLATTPEVDEAATAADPPRPTDLPLDVPLPPSRPTTPPPLAPLPPASRVPKRRSSQSLTALLRRADDLYAAYPPTHEELKFEATLGPASAMRTWNEREHEMPSDADAERFVVAGVDVIYQEIVESSEDDDEPDAHGYENEKRTFFGFARRRRAGKGKGGRAHERRKLHKHRRPVFGGLVVERRTMIAGAALVLGVAMAVSVYGSARGGGRAGVAGVAGLGQQFWNALGKGTGFGF